jgi:hypothetical protein
VEKLAQKLWKYIVKYASRSRYMRLDPLDMNVTATKECLAISVRHAELYAQQEARHN